MVALGLAAAALTACGGSSGPTRNVTSEPTGAGSTATGAPLQPSIAPTTVPSSGPETPPASPGAPRAGEPCATAQLAVEQTEGQGAAGTDFSGITFRNRSTTTCTLQGYPGVSLLDHNRRQIGEPAQRVPGSSPVVSLDPGQAATASLSVTPAACSSGRPQQSAYLRVFPPNQRADVVIAAQVYACQPAIRPVHPGGHISPG